MYHSNYNLIVNFVRIFNVFFSIQKYKSAIFQYIWRTKLLFMKRLLLIFFLSFSIWCWNQSYSYRFSGTIDPLKWERISETMKKDFGVGEAKLFQKENAGEIRFKMLPTVTTKPTEDQHFSIASAMKQLLIDNGMEPLSFVEINK